MQIKTTWTNQIFVPTTALDAWTKHIKQKETFKKYFHFLCLSFVSLSFHSVEREQSIRKDRRLEVKDEMHWREDYGEGVELGGRGVGAE